MIFHDGRILRIDRGNREDRTSQKRIEPPEITRSGGEGVFLERCADDGGWVAVLARGDLLRRTVTSISVAASNGSRNQVDRFVPPPR